LLTKRKKLIRWMKNESVTELETRIDGLRADSRFSAGRFNNIIDWLNSKENSLSAQQKDYIRQLTAKVKSPDRLGSMIQRNDAKQH